MSAAPLCSISVPGLFFCFFRLSAVWLSISSSYKPNLKNTNYSFDDVSEKPLLTSANQRWSQFRLPNAELLCSSYGVLNIPQPACETCSSSLHCEAPQCLTNAVKIADSEKWNPQRRDISVLWKPTLISHPSSQSCIRLTASKMEYNCAVNVLGNWCIIVSLYELFISGCCFSKLELPRLKRFKERFITLPAVKWEYIKVRLVDRFCDKCHIYNALGEMMAADNLPSWYLPICWLWLRFVQR